jgi:sugar lactone lactonase YvrE
MPFFGSLGTLGILLGRVLNVVSIFLNQVTTLAGNGTQGAMDGTGTNATFNNIFGISVATTGIVYVAQYGTGSVRTITPAGVVSTLAGGFNGPYGVGVDSSGNAYVAAYVANRIHKVTPLGVSTIFAGNVEGSANGVGTNANFTGPIAITVESSGNLYVLEYDGHRVRKITPEGVVTTFAGGGAGFTNGTGTNAQFRNPRGVAVDSAGNVYVADLSNSSIRKITSGGVVSTLAGTFSGPTGVGVDSAGNVYVSETNNSRISKITPGGIVTTLAGGTAGFADGIGTNAQFQNPQSLTVDSAGNVYVVDTGNRRIRKIS